MEMNHVLVVEDDKEIREGVKIYLKSQGYEVYEAADGIEGLKVLEKEEIHLAIVDIMMPRLDGIRMTMKLREKYDFPVIMLSAKSEEVDKVMGLNIGADDYVTKPFNVEVLILRMRKLIDLYGKRRQRLRIEPEIYGAACTEGKYPCDRRSGDQRGYGGSICGRRAGQTDTDRVQNSAVACKKSGKSFFFRGNL